jgi:hypothetical protein
MTGAEQEDHSFGHFLFGLSAHTATGWAALAARDWVQHRDHRSTPSSQRYDPSLGIEDMKLDRQAVREEMEQASKTFHHLLNTATVAELNRPSNGTKWTNGQLLFHMLFGYLIVVRLLALVRIFGRLPDSFSRVFASALEASTTPFHAINYFGSLCGPRLLGYAGMGRRFDKVIAILQRRLDRERDTELARGMHYPTSWDPYFKAYMTLADIYRYPTQHFEHHRRQLTLRTSEPCQGRVGPWSGRFLPVRGRGQRGARAAQRA